MCCTNFEYSKVSLEAVNKPFYGFSQYMFPWKKAEVHNIQKDIAEFGSTFKNETNQNIESMWQSFKTEIKSIIDKRVPT
jgi:hypothetical protein